jgi:hypothetical protein
MNPIVTCLVLFFGLTALFVVNVASPVSPELDIDGCGLH